MRGWCRGHGRSSLRLALGCCVLLLRANAQAAPVGVAAASGGTAVAAIPTTHDERAILTLFVDDAAYGETAVIVRDTDILVSVAALEKGGLHSLGGAREVVYGKEMVSLASLTPAITYKFNEVELTLRI